MANDHLALLRSLPDGTVLHEDHDFTRRLHEGDPTVGWTGDPRLGVYVNPGTDRIEVWRHCEDGIPRRIIQSRPGHRLLDSGLLRWLAEHDTQSRRGYSAEEMMAEIQRAQDAAAKARREQTDEVGERMAWALRRDLGSEIDGMSRDFYSMPGRRDQ